MHQYAINTRSARDITIMACSAGSGSLEVQLWRGGRGQSFKKFEGQQTALAEDFAAWLQRLDECQVVLHRVVHSGDIASNPQPVNAASLALIRHWSTLAPLHNAFALKVIDTVATHQPGAKQFIFSDSVLYRDMPARASRYALPPELSARWPIKKYGFHGLAHRNQWRGAQAQKNYAKVISIHLGGGGSITAWENGQVLDTTMGFTPLDGIAMTTRSGSLDPNIVLHLLEHEGFTAQQLKTLFNQDSGLKGVSGISGDLRDLRASDSASAHFAVDLLCYQITKAVGGFIAVLGGVDAICFGGGLAENQPIVREKCLAPLRGLGIRLSERANGAVVDDLPGGKGDDTEYPFGATCALHEKGSPTDIWLTPAQECWEMVIQFEAFNRDSRKEATND